MIDQKLIPNVAGLDWGYFRSNMAARGYDSSLTYSAGMLDTQGPNRIEKNKPEFTRQNSDEGWRQEKIVDDQWVIYTPEFQTWREEGYTLYNEPDRYTGVLDVLPSYGVNRNFDPNTFDAHTIETGLYNIVVWVDIHTNKILQAVSGQKMKGDSAWFQSAVLAAITLVATSGIGSAVSAATSTAATSTTVAAAGTFSVDAGALAINAGVKAGVSEISSQVMGTQGPTLRGVATGFASSLAASSAMSGYDVLTTESKMDDIAFDFEWVSEGQDFDLENFWGGYYPGGYDNTVFTDAQVVDFGFSEQTTDFDMWRDVGETDGYEGTFEGYSDYVQTDTIINGTPEVATSDFGTGQFTSDYFRQLTGTGASLLTKQAIASASSSTADVSPTPSRSSVSAGSILQTIMSGVNMAAQTVSQVKTAAVAVGGLSSQKETRATTTNVGQLGVNSANGPTSSMSVILLATGVIIAAVVIFKGKV